MPHLQKLYEKYRAQGLEMVAINTVPAEDQDLAAWQRKRGYTFPVLLSAKDFAWTTYDVSGAPTNFLLDAGRKLVFRHVGYAPGDEKRMEAEIRELLGLDPFTESESPRK